MGIKLTVKERLVIQSLLPKEGNFMTLKLMRILKEELSFSDEEIKKLEFVQSGELLNWNQEAAEGVVKDVEVGETMMNLIVETLSDMNKNSKLTDDHITLYEKFVEGKQECESEAPATNSE